MAPLRIAIAQIDTTVGDPQGNSEKVLEWSLRAKQAGADLVIFPEMTLTGYPIEDLALRASFRRGADTALDSLIKGLNDADARELTVVLGTLGPPSVHGIAGTPSGLPRNRAVVVRGGEVIASYDKVHLPNYGVFDEQRIFSPGDSPTIFDLNGVTFSLAICEDIWQDSTAISWENSGADALLVLNGSPFEVGKQHQRVERAARRAKEIGGPLVYANLVGGQDDLVFDGHSFVIDAAGIIVARAPQFEENLLLWDMPDDDSSRSEVSATKSSAVSPAPAASPIPAELSIVGQIYQAATLGLAGYAKKNNFTSVVLGLSGGIDSALVAVMAADALGGENVFGVSMPSQYSSDHSKDDAADLAARIGASYRTVSIAPIVEAFLGQVPLTGVAEENLQARVRGMILMGLSNQEGHLTLATGNKSELAVGYSTIYGDAVGGYAPLKDIDKSMVWALSRWRNDQAVDAGLIPPIPESSITKPPSAELRPGQVDQDSLPPYDVLDQVLGAYVEFAEGREELLARGFDPAVVDKVVSLVDRAEWKRRQYPLGPKVSAVAFGRDRRLPITSRWREPATSTNEMSTAANINAVENKQSEES